MKVIYNIIHSGWSLAWIFMKERVTRSCRARWLILVWNVHIYDFCRLWWKIFETAISTKLSCAGSYIDLFTDLFNFWIILIFKKEKNPSYQVLLVKGKQSLNNKWGFKDRVRAMCETRHPPEPSLIALLQCTGPYINSDILSLILLWPKLQSAFTLNAS